MLLALQRGWLPIVLRQIERSGVRFQQGRKLYRRKVLGSVQLSFRSACSQAMGLNETSVIAAFLKIERAECGINILMKGRRLAA